MNSGALKPYTICRQCETEKVFMAVLSSHFKLAFNF